MILDGGSVTFGRLGKESLDVLIYGLGFETRSTKLPSVIGHATRTLAIRMSGPSIHSLKRNVAFAHTQKHQVVGDDGPIESSIAEAIERSRRGDKPIRIAFDVSSVNRLVLFDVLLALSRFANPRDEIEVLYCPAAFVEPIPQFPCIEKLGPISGGFSGFDADPAKPLCLIMGVGFDAGVSMGIISHLEPRLTYCLWGTGVSKEFDNAVKKANFDFDFTGFNTKVLSYDLKDPVGTFQMLDNITYGLRNEFRVVMMPMGPKLLTVHTALIGIAYFGEVGIWRVQHSRFEPPDSQPGSYAIRARLMTDVLVQFAQRQQTLFA
ncbi:hypothetical protein [Bradyrhizobium sp. LB11.1]|uniref:hypothetical protein n=1 Tax=Bradyrhizobium sp. LB11.1 TaxID=3156326 RepID=UPI0033962532